MLAAAAKRANLPKRKLFSSPLTEARSPLPDRSSVAPMSRFCNRLHRRIDAAGLPLECIAHGQRKAMPHILAESGVTNQEGRAVTAHKTDRKFTRSAETANKADMADNGTAYAEKKFSKNRR